MKRSPLVSIWASARIGDKLVVPTRYRLLDHMNENRVSVSYRSLSISGVQALVHLTSPIR